MKKICLFSFFVAVCAMNINAQVTMGSLDAPTQGALLELKDTTLGFLPTRVLLRNLTVLTPIVGNPADCKGMVVFNTAVEPTAGLIPGLYVWEGTRWAYLTVATSTKENWFYMPSIVINTEELNVPKTLELYALYQEQLNTAGDNTYSGKGKVVSSDPAAPMVLAKVPAANELIYYVTAYDSIVFKDVTISPTGTLSYTVKEAASDSTFMNIVFVEK